MPIRSTTVEGGPRARGFLFDGVGVRGGWTTGVETISVGFSTGRDGARARVHECMRMNARGGSFAGDGDDDDGDEDEDGVDVDVDARSVGDRTARAREARSG